MRIIKRFNFDQIALFNDNWVSKLTTEIKILNTICELTISLGARTIPVRIATLLPFSLKEYFHILKVHTTKRFLLLLVFRKLTIIYTH
jgi:hypothetical protein